MEEKYIEGDIVWIKLKGYPWWPGIIYKFISSQECIVKFFIELSESKINITKIRPFDKYREEFSKTKLKKLKNIIKIAEMISKGEMTFEQHIIFAKRGLQFFEEQHCELIKMKKEKGNMEIKKREKERLYNIKNTKKFKTIKRRKFLGNKRKYNESKNIYNSNMTKELICSIDEFIFHKRELKLINGYDSYFDEMKQKISKSMLNTSGLNALLKLYKHMNNYRNFSPDISNKNSFISLKDEINKKIKEALFDHNSLFSSSSFNFFCSNYNNTEIVQEGINISKLLDNLSSLEYGDTLGNHINISNKKDEKLKNHKKLSDSDDDKSTSFGSKQGKIIQNEENKQKLNIGLLKYNDLFNLFDITGTNNEICEVDKEKVILKIKEIENEMKGDKDDIKNECLRKNVCLKLYKAFSFALKNFDFKESDIKHLCLYIEKKGRIIDNTMNDKYKEFIEGVLKRISCEALIQNNK